MRLVLTLLALLCLFACSPGTNSPPKPNVVIIMTDDQGYGDMSCHGNPFLKTPHLDDLYHMSTRLTNFHVDPTCSPTRAALMTGRYSTRTGVWLTYMGRHYLRKDEVTMANMFEQNGYRTAIFGKWHLGDNYPYRPGDRGFQTSLVHGGGVVGEAPDYWGNDYYDDTYLRNGEPEKEEGYCTDVWFREALEFVKSDEQEPFFLYIPTNAPHNPFNVPKEYTRPYMGVDGIPEQRAMFYGMISNIDKNIGSFQKSLEEEGLLDNTILIFLTDNGTAAGFSGDEGFNAGMRSKKGSAYEGGHRAACFIRWPAGGIEAGRDLEGLTAHMDLMPTLEGLCNLDFPGDFPFDGVDLTEYLKGENQMDLPDRTLFVHHQGRFGQEVLDDRPIKYKDYAVMKGSWRRVGGQLFNLHEDPGQQKDIALLHPELMEELGEAYELWWNDVTERSHEYTRTSVGSEHQPLTMLTCQGWHGTDVPYNQQHVRNAMVANGFWDLWVEREGLYAIELRRWPREADAVIDEAVQLGILDPNRHSTLFKLYQLPTIKTDVVLARIKVGAYDKTVDVNPGQKAVKFEVPLKPGKVNLQSWFTDRDGIERGAYYIYIQYLKEN